MNINRQKYDAALEVFRAAARVFRVVQISYRNTQIGDTEFLAARRVYNDAQIACDVAEAEYIAGLTPLETLRALEA